MLSHAYASLRCIHRYIDSFTHFFFFFRLEPFRNLLFDTHYSHSTAQSYRLLVVHTRYNKTQLTPSLATINLIIIISYANSSRYYCAAAAAAAVRRTKVENTNSCKVNEETPRKNHQSNLTKFWLVNLHTNGSEQR